MSKYPGNIVTTGADAGYSVLCNNATTSFVVMTNASAAINPTTSTTPFTIECWVYTNGTTTTTLYAALASENYGFTLGFGSSLGTYDSTQTPWFGNYTGAWNGIRSNTPVAFRTWTHIACVFTGSTFYIYQNGVLTASGGPTTWQVTGSSKVRIGCRPDGPDAFTGYIAGARVVIGTNLYPGGTTFTPPTVPLNIANTQLLVCNSPDIVDQSNNAFPLTVFGAAAASTFSPYTGYQAYNPALGAATPGIWTVTDALQASLNRSWNMYDPYFNYTTLKLSGTPVTNVPTWITDSSTNNFAVTPVADARAAGLSPFSNITFPNSGSGYFDGTGDQLTVANNSAFEFGSGDFTVEFWVYPTGNSGSIINYSNGQTSASNFSWEVYQSNTTSIQAAILQGTTTYATTTTYTQNAWNHVAAVRNGNSLTIYVNGVAGPTPSNVTGVTISTRAGATLKICGYNNATGMITGYVSNVRIVKGVAVYTGNFTAPTAPLTVTQNAGTNISAITGTSTSLLTLQSSQGGNNNVFVDNSSNNYLITRNGNATQGTFSPFSQTGWSYYFDGTTRVDITNAAFAFGTGDFSVTFYMYRITGTYIMGTGNTAGSWAFTMSGSFRINTLASDLITGNAPVNQWSKVQVMRVGTTVSLFINDALQGTATSSQNFTNTGFAIGGFGQSTSFQGTAYVANLVIVKAGVTVLDTCRNNRFLDNSSNNFALVLQNNPSVQPFSPFNTNNAYTPATIGGSAYLDGSDYLTSSFAPSGTGNFTIEGWVYITAHSGGAGEWGVFQTSTNAGGFEAGYTTGVTLLRTGGVFRLYVLGNSVTSTYTIPLNTWIHFAAVRNSGTVTLYINGTSSGTPVSATGNVAANNIVIGGYFSTTYLMTGYVSGFRAVNSAVYTANFTPPTSPPGIVAFTQYLLNFTNAGIADTTSKFALETVGDARTSTAVSKFGGSSMFFDGTGDNLSIPSSPLLAMGSGNWTFETWLYANSVSSLQAILTFGGSAWRIFLNNSGIWFLNGSTSILDTGQSVIATGQWYHIALVKNGTGAGAVRCYINGVASSVTGTDSNTYAAAVAQIGAEGTGSYLNGYLQDMRVTRGVARYLSNFTPPTSLLQNQ